MSRDSNVLKMSFTSNMGVQPFENPQLKVGAEDSISGENQTQPFAPSASAKNAVKGSLGGEKGNV